MKTHLRIALALLMAAAVTVDSTARGGSQMFPTKRPARGLSVYLVSPAEGMESDTEKRLWIHSLLSRITARWRASNHQ